MEVSSSLHRDGAVTGHRVPFSHIPVPLLPIKSGINGKMQLRELNKEQRFPQLPPLVCSSSAAWPVLRALGWDKSSQNEPLDCGEPSRFAGAVAQTMISPPDSKARCSSGKGTSQQPGLFLTKFYCKFLLKDILIIYKL